MTDEVIGLGDEVFLQAWKICDERPVGPLLRTMLSRAAGKIAAKRGREIVTDDASLLDSTVPDRVATGLRIDLWQETLSPAAKVLVEVLLDRPAAYGLTGQEHPKQARTKIRATLREIGWSWNLIWSTFQEIRRELVNL